MNYGDLHLGKTTVLAKDTPAFIANRIGVYGIMAIFGLVEKLGLNIDDIDALTGPGNWTAKVGDIQNCGCCGYRYIGESGKRRI